MRAATVVVRLASIFGLTLLAGLGVATIYLGVAGRSNEPREVGSRAPAAAGRDTLPSRAPARAEPLPPAAVSPGSAGADAETDRLTARERRSRRDLRAMMREVLAGKLADRELAPDDYDRLAETVLRLRAATRSLRNTDDSAAGDAARVEQRAVVLAALAEVEAITGVPPSELGSLLSADETVASGGDDEADVP